MRSLPAWLRAPSAGGGRDAGVDGLRGIAAIAVLAYHVATTPGGAISPWIAPVGDAAVAVFFAISGYLLWRPVARAVLAGAAAPSPGPFLLRRATRILPAYWVAITVAFWLLDSGRPSGGADVLAQYTLTQIYRNGGPGLFVAWTLACEIAFSVLVVLLAALLVAGPARRAATARVGSQLAIVAALVVIAFASRHVILHGPATGGWRLQWPPNLVDWFALGMLLAIGRARGELGTPLPRWLLSALSAPWAWWPVAAACYFAMTRAAARPTITPSLVQGTRVLLAVFVLAVLTPVVLGNPRTEPVASLHRGPVAFVGVVSYGTYLWHAAWLRVIDRWSASGTIPHAYLPRLLLTLALTLPCAWASWVFVERPCTAWARARGAKPGLAPSGTG